MVEKPSGKMRPAWPAFSTKSLNCARNQFEFRFTALDSCQESIADCLRDVDVPETPAPSVTTPRASFNCDAPSSALEIAICADAELGQLDIQLAQAHHDAKTTTIPAQQGDLIAIERQWLGFVGGACPLAVVGGIPSVFERSCLRAAFQTRITQLQTCPQQKPEERVSCLNDFQVLEKKQPAH
jgi:uncharacterized protein YecT (DUF1311 family)